MVPRTESSLTADVENNAAKGLKREETIETSMMMEQAKSSKVVRTPKQRNHEGAGGGRRYFALTLSSNFFFLVGSVLYLYMALEELWWLQSTGSIPPYVLQADDDYTWLGYEDMYDDDYILQVGQTWVSRYMILYFCAALCFVTVGTLDFIKEPGCLGIFMILAGGFGLASAMLVEKNERLSTIFNLVSVHLFFLEAGGLLLRRSFYGGLRFWLRLSDMIFLVGALIDVALSYVHLFNKFTIPLAKLQAFSAGLWIACSLIYVGSTIYIQKHGGYAKAVRHKEDETDHMDESEDETDHAEETERTMWA